ncbi:4-hydroxyphenylacetate 3-hydroxylase family protein [Pigmentiphaga kullae]|uniref:4-hydroxyphenylacetate 3-monooxygenase n=1 Tax=Pigmentiphaga kullae TaxID=151784 RepID=A0A4Q7NNS2_9BURK|nr:4-hydroxyphenylacetate 3-hydroxylase N-terminal domain-containing protein [Pigmentiphaga kullae]RZS86596.1 4-hydroxyphenylacetate 3-monooxygenase [Pigmentiphaga kullae]
MTQAAKTGSDHLKALQDGRWISINGEVVSNHIEHPAFRAAVKTAADLYDFSSASPNLEKMTFRSPTSGRAVSRAWQLPTTYQELVERRQALEQIACNTSGWVGRTPDHVASTLSAMVMGIDLFERHGVKRASALQEYFTWARDNDIWAGYAIVPPQTDRQPPARQGDFINASVCDEDSEGITIKGARQLATGLPMAQELLLGAVQPLKPGDERASFTAMVPVNAKGVKLMSRKSYEQLAGSTFDYPLSSRFDENDTVVYCDEVKIPWDRVFVHNDIQMARAQWFDIPVMAYQNYPAQIRLSVKLRFLLGLAYRMAQENGLLALPPVMETLGQMAAEVNVVQGMITAMETNGVQYGKYFIPNSSIQYSAMVYSQSLYPAFIARMRELAGGSMLSLPSSVADFTSSATAEYVERTHGTAKRSAVDRVKLFNLGWDAIGSEFASRHAQYEIFYSGPAFGNRIRNYSAYDWGQATTLVDNFLSSYDGPAGPVLGA